MNTPPTDQATDAQGGAGELLPCPFCGSKMHLDYDPKSGMFGPEGDHERGCLIGSIDLRDYADEHHAVAAWNNRAALPPSVANVNFALKLASARGHLANVRAHGNAEANAVQAIASALDAAEAIATLSSAPEFAKQMDGDKALREAGEAKSISAAEEWSVYMDEAVSKAPEPLRKLGEFLAGVLDEDHWKTAERYLNAAALAPSNEPANAAGDEAVEAAADAAVRANVQ